MRRQKLQEACRGTVRFLTRGDAAKNPRIELPSGADDRPTIWQMQRGVGVGQGVAAIRPAPLQAGSSLDAVCVTVMLAGVGVVEEGLVLMVETAKERADIRLGRYARTGLK